MEAIALSKNDHTSVCALLDELESTTSRGVKKRGELLASIGKELRIHTPIEDDLFYPAFKAAGEKSDDAKMFFEAMEEYRVAGGMVLPDLEGTDAGSDPSGGRANTRVDGPQPNRRADGGHGHPAGAVAACRHCFPLSLMSTPQQENVP